MGKHRIDLVYGVNIDQASLKKAEESLSKLQIALISNKMTKNGITAELKEARKAAADLEKILSKSYNSSLGTYNMATFTKGIKEAGYSFQSLQQKMYAGGNEGIRTWTQLNSAILKQKPILKESNKMMDSLFETFGKTVRWGLSSSVFNTVTSQIHQAYNFTIALDSALNDIEIVTGKSASNMQELAKWANDSAKKLSASTTEMADAALIFYQQGDTDKEAQRKAEISMKVANVTGQDSAATSDEMTAIWNGFQAKAEDMEAYGDKMAKVAASTASSFEELSKGMQKVAATANTTGVDFDQLNAQLSTIVSVTREAPESVGTALKTIYARMGDLKVEGQATDESGFTTTLGDVTGTMSKMGVNVLDEAGSMRDLGEVIEEVGDKWQNWTRNQQEAAAVALAGKRQYTQLMALFNNWDMYTEAKSTSLGAEGTLQEQQEIYEERMTALQQKLKTSAEGLYQDLFNADDLKPFVKGLTNVIGALDKVVKSFGNGKVAIAAFGLTLTKVFNKQIQNSIQKTLSHREIDAQNKALANYQKNLATTNKVQIKGDSDRIKEVYGSGNKLGFNATSANRFKAQQQNFNANLQRTAETQGAVAEYEALQRTLGVRKQIGLAITDEYQKSAENYALEEKELAILETKENQLKEIFTAYNPSFKTDTYDDLDNIYTELETTENKIKGELEDNTFADKYYDDEDLKFWKGWKEKNQKKLSKLIPTANFEEIAKRDFSNKKPTEVTAEELQQKIEELDAETPLSEGGKRSGSDINREKMIYDAQLKKLEDIERIKKEIEDIDVEIANIEDDKKPQIEAERKELEQELQLIQDLQIKEAELYNIREKKRKTEDKVKQLKEELSTMDKAAATNQVYAQSFSMITNGLTAMTSAWSMFQSLGSIFNDDDLSVAEKMGQALMIIGMQGSFVLSSFAGVMNSVKSLSGALGELQEIEKTEVELKKAEEEATEAAKVATEAEAAAKEAETQGEVANAEAKEASKDATEGQTVAQEGENAVTEESTVVTTTHGEAEVMDAEAGGENAASDVVQTGTEKTKTEAEREDTHQLNAQSGAIEQNTINQNANSASDVVQAGTERSKAGTYFSTLGKGFTDTMGKGSIFASTFSAGGAKAIALGISEIAIAVVAVVGAFKVWKSVLKQFAQAGVEVTEQQDKFKKEITASKTAIQSFSKQITDLGNNLKELPDNLKQIESLSSSLDTMTSGTLKWTSSVTELNSQVEKLLETYPQLEKYFYTDERGVYHKEEDISDEQIEAEIATAEEKRRLQLQAQKSYSENYEKTHSADEAFARIQDQSTTVANTEASIVGKDASLLVGVINPFVAALTGGIATAIGDGDITSFGQGAIGAMPFSKLTSQETRQDEVKELGRENLLGYAAYDKYFSNNQFSTEADFEEERNKVIERLENSELEYGLQNRQYDLQNVKNMTFDQYNKINNVASGASDVDKDFLRSSSYELNRQEDEQARTRIFSYGKESIGADLADNKRYSDEQKALIKNFAVTDASLKKAVNKADEIDKEKLFSGKNKIDTEYLKYIKDFAEENGMEGAVSGSNKDGKVSITVGDRELEESEIEQIVSEIKAKKTVDAIENADINYDEALERGKSQVEGIARAKGDLSEEGKSYTRKKLNDYLSGEADDLKNFTEDEIKYIEAHADELGQVVEGGAEQVGKDVTAAGEAMKKAQAKLNDDQKEIAEKYDMSISGVEALGNIDITQEAWQKLAEKFDENKYHVNELAIAYSNTTQELDGGIDPLSKFKEELEKQHLTLEDVGLKSKDFRDNLETLQDALIASGKAAVQTGKDFANIWNQIKDLETGSVISEETATELKEQLGKDFYKYFAEGMRDAEGNKTYTMVGSSEDLQQAVHDSSEISRGDTTGRKSTSVLESKDSIQQYAASINDINTLLNSNLSFEEMSNQVKILKANMIATGVATESQFKKVESQVKKTAKAQELYNKAQKEDDPKKKAADLKAYNSYVRATAAQYLNAKNALQELGGAWDGLNKTIKGGQKNTKEYQDAINEVKSKLNDAFGSEEYQLDDILSDDFVANHREMIGKALNGDKEAAEELRKEITKEKVSIWDEKKFDKGIKDNKQEVKKLKNDVLKETDKIANKINKLNPGEKLAESALKGYMTMLTQAGKTKDQIQAIFQGLNYDIDVTAVLKAVSFKKRKADYTPTDITVEELTELYGGNAASDIINHATKDALEERKRQAARELNERNKAWNKKEEARIKRETSQGNGGKQKTTDGEDFTPSVEDTSKDSSKKDTNKGAKVGKVSLIKYDPDPYEKINEALNKIEHQLSKLEKIQSRLTGEALTKNLIKQVALSKDQVKYAKQKEALAKQEQKRERKSLEDTINTINKKYGTKIKKSTMTISLSTGKDEKVLDDEKILENAQEVLNKKLKKINTAIEKYDKQKKKTKKEENRLKKLKSKAEKMKEQWETLQQDAQDYDDSISAWYEADEAWLEANEKFITSITNVFEGRFQDLQKVFDANDRMNELANKALELEQQRNENEVTRTNNLVADTYGTKKIQAQGQYTSSLSNSLATTKATGEQLKRNKEETQSQLKSSISKVGDTVDELLKNKQLKDSLSKTEYSELTGKLKNISTNLVKKYNSLANDKDGYTVEDQKILERVINNTSEDVQKIINNNPNNDAKEVIKGFQQFLDGTFTDKIQALNNTYNDIESSIISNAAETEDKKRQLAQEQFNTIIIKYDVEFDENELKKTLTDVKKSIHDAFQLDYDTTQSLTDIVDLIKITQDNVSIASNKFNEILPKLDEKYLNQKTVDELKDLQSKLQSNISDFISDYQALLESFNTQTNAGLEMYNKWDSLLDSADDILNKAFTLQQTFNSNDPLQTRQYEFNESQIASLQRRGNALSVLVNDEIPSFQKQWEEQRDKYNTATNDKEKSAAQNMMNTLQDNITNIATASVENITQTAQLQLQNLNIKLTNIVKTSFATLNGELLEEAQKAFQWLQTVSKRYLDQTERIYQTQAFSTYANKLISESDNINYQNRLTQVYKEQLKILQQKDKLSQYDVDRAKKLLDLEIKRQALEDARNAKNSLKLRRDTSGNWSYQYVADPAKIADAQAAYDQAKNDVYELDKQNLTTSLSNYYSDMQAMQNEILSISAEKESDEWYKTYNKIVDKYRDVTIYNAQDVSTRWSNIQQSSGLNWNQMSTAERTQAAKDIGFDFNTLQSAMRLLTSQDYEKEFSALGIQANTVVQGMSTVISTATESLSKFTKIMDDLAGSDEAMMAKLTSAVKSQEEAYTKVNNILYGEDGESGLLKALSEAETNFTKINEIIQKANGAGSPPGDGNGDTDPKGDTSDGTNKTDGNTGDGTSSHPKGASGDGGSRVTAVSSSKPGYDGTKVTYPKLKERVKKWTDNKKHKGLLESAANPGGTLARESVIAQIYNVWRTTDQKKKKVPKMEQSIKYAIVQYLKDYKIKGFKSGGYTGSWSDSTIEKDNGKLAWLHQKELILNASDTSNMLKTVGLVRDMVQQLNGSSLSSINTLLGSLNKIVGSNINNKTECANNTININADFPSVQSSAEIEKAFKNLTSVALQKASVNTNITTARTTI